MVDFLLTQGADIHAVNQKNNTCGDIFWTMVLSNGLPESEYRPLESRFASSDYVDEGHFTYVHRMVFKTGHLGLEETLSASAKCINQQDAYGRTPLAWAAARGDISSVDILLRYGANPNIVEKGGWGPLHNSILTENPEISLRLLQAGADPNLSSKVFRDTPLHIACRARGLACHIPGLLQYHADASLPCKMYDSALEFAASRGYGGTVELLVQSTPRDRHTKAVIAAMRSDALEALESLLRNGADCSGIDSDGKNILHHTAIHASNNTLCLLLKYGVTASHHQPDHTGSTPVDIMARRSSNEAWTKNWKELLKFSAESLSIPPASEYPEGEIFVDAQEYIMG